jgi:hypothetical protein
MPSPAGGGLGGGGDGHEVLVPDALPLAPSRGEGGGTLGPRPASLYRNIAGPNVIRAPVGATLVANHPGEISRFAGKPAPTRVPYEITADPAGAALAILDKAV